MSDNSFKVKNSLVLTPVDLSTLPNPQAGDIACDINDSNKIKRYDSATSSWVEVGDFKGPASSTDDALVKFDGTTGKLVQNTAAILSDAGALSGLTGVTSSGSATFSGALNTSSNTTESAATGSSAVIASATTSVIRLTNTSLISVGGYANVTSGRRTTLINATGRDVIIKHEDSSVTAAQRISIGSGSDISLPNGGSIDFIYNATTTRHQAVGPFSSRSISANLSDARPSLNLDFANSKTLDPRVTFSRNSVAHKVNEKGLLELVPVNQPRFDHNPVTGESKGLLIEESRTNLLEDSEDFQESVWTKTRASINSNMAIAPDGTLTADKLVEDTTANNTHFVSQTPSFVSGTTYTLSVFAKQDTRSGLELRFTGTGAFSTNQAVVFNLLTGVGTASVGTATFSITPYPNGWYRCSITATADSTGSAFAAYRLDNGTSSTYTGNGISGLFVWGAQLEVGSFPTSYMPSSISFTSRASSASYIDADGLVKYAGSNEARQNYLPTDLSLAPKLLLEESRTNLLSYTENFDNAAYTKTRSYIQADAEIAPDGSRTADKLVEDTTASATHITTRSVSFTSGSTYTFSVFAKKSERGFLRLVLGSAAFGSVIGGFFDLEQGVLGSVSSGIINHNIESFGNGWYRCSITATATATASAPMDIAIAFSTTSSTYTGDGLSGLFIWGAQLEIGAYPTSYIPSSQTFTSRTSTGTFIGSNGLIQSAAINVARQNYNPLNLALTPKLLLEESRTNLLQRSAEFNDVYWTKTRSSITANAAVAPDGTLSADKLVEDTSTNTHLVTRGSLTLDTSQPVTISVFVKSSERTFLFLGGFGAAVNNITHGQYFDIENNTLGFKTDSEIVTNSSIEKYNNGWCRVSVTITAAVSGAFNLGLYSSIGGSVGNINYTGDGTSGIFIWGAQLEVGAYPTSYISTTTASVVRSADVSTSAAVTRAADVSSSAATTREADIASMTGENFSSWYRQDEGTFAVEYKESFKPIGSTNRVFRVSDGGSVNYIEAISSTNKNPSMQIVYNGTVQTLLTGSNSIISNQKSKVSFFYKVNDIGFSADGQSLLTDLSATLPFVNQINLGSTVASGSSLNSTISQISYYPERLSDAQIQAMSGTSNGLVGSSADQAPTNSMLGSLAFLDKLVDSNVIQIQPAPASFSVGGSLSASNIRSKIIVFNGSSASLQLPTGVSLELSEMSRLADASFDFSVIASGVGNATLTVNTGVTIVGNAVVSSGATGMFRARRTSANNYVVYRIG